MKTRQSDGWFIISLEGRVDSSNAAKVQDELLALRDANPDGDLALDADNLEYISSAGLRILLRLKKANPTFKMINVSSDVYEVLDMTGFTEMMEVEKAYRKLSVDGCEVIGQGANGKVYRLDPDTIIKVYMNPDSLPDIQRERELARRAFVLGVPTAIPYDVVRVGDGYGSVFELLNAKSLCKILQKDASQLDYCVKESVELLKTIHGTVVKPEDMPDMKEVALKWARDMKDELPAETYEKVYSLIDAIPTDHHMMHGDYHIKNVMIQNGESLLIDMDTLCQGNPVFEFASAYNAYVGYGDTDPNMVADFMGIPYDLAGKFWRRSLEEYFGTTDKDVLDTVEKKAMLIGFLRIMRRSIRRGGKDTESGSRVIASAKQHIIDIAAQLDTLML